MDQFAAMRAYVKVVETNGFSEAARQLQMAVSSVTRQVNALPVRVVAMLHRDVMSAVGLVLGSCQPARRQLGTIPEHL